MNEESGAESPRVSDVRRISKSSKTVMPIYYISAAPMDRNAVRRKIAAYHRHIQLGLIAQRLCPDAQTVKQLMES